MKTVLEIAFDLASELGVYELRENRNKVIDASNIEGLKNAPYMNSVYFTGNDGVEYRVSDHELPYRRYMTKHNYINEETALLKGVDGANLYHKNNIEFIVSKGKVDRVYRNFNK